MSFSWVVNAQNMFRKADIKDGNIESKCMPFSFMSCIASQSFTKATLRLALQTDTERWIYFVQRKQMSSFNIQGRVCKIVETSGF